MSIRDIRKKLTLVVSTLAVSVLTLTACGGTNSSTPAPGDASSNGLNGEYIDESQASPVADLLGTMTIENGTVTYELRECDGDVWREDDTSIGQLADDSSSILWTQDGNWSGNDAVVVSGDAVSIGSDRTFVAADSDAGQALRAEVCGG